MPDEPPLHAQPANLPPIETPFDGPVTGYGVDYSGTAPPIEEPKPATKVMHFDDDDDTPITVAPPPDIAGTDREKIAAELAKPSERELALHLRDRPQGAAKSLWRRDRVLSLRSQDDRPVDSL